MYRLFIFQLQGKVADQKFDAGQVEQHRYERQFNFSTSNTAVNLCEMTLNCATGTFKKKH